MFLVLMCDCESWRSVNGVGVNLACDECCKVRFLSLLKMDLRRLTELVRPDTDLVWMEFCLRD